MLTLWRCIQRGTRLSAHHGRNHGLSEALQRRCRFLGLVAAAAVDALAICGHRRSSRPLVTSTSVSCPQIGDKRTSSGPVKWQPLTQRGLKHSANGGKRYRPRALQFELGALTISGRSASGRDSSVRRSLDCRFNLLQVAIGKAADDQRCDDKRDLHKPFRQEKDCEKDRREGYADVRALRRPRQLSPWIADSSPR